MKLLTILLTLGLAFSTDAFAAKGKAAKGQRREFGAAIKAADKNSNRKIDSDEVASLEEALAKAGSDSRLKKIDRNGDGKLSDDEVKALNTRMAKRAEGGKKKKSQ